MLHFVGYVKQSHELVLYTRRGFVVRIVCTPNMSPVFSVKKCNVTCVLDYTFHYINELRPILVEL